MSIWPTRAFQPEKPSSIAILWLVLASFAMLLHATAYFLGGRAIWSSPAVLIAITVAVIGLNSLLAPAGSFCFPNIFLALLSLFHLGYYLPAATGLTAQLPFMPAVEGPIADTAMALYVAAVLAFFIGTTSAKAFASFSSAMREGTRETDVLITSGYILAGSSFVLLLVFLIQVGGPLALARMSYEEIFAFLLNNDSRFALTGLQLVPTGLMMVYAGASLYGNRERLAGFAAGALAVVIAVQLLLGSRGGALLSMIAWMYLRHHLRKKFSSVSLVVILAAILFVIPTIRSYRNVAYGGRSSAARTATISWLDAISEMGLTYRPLFGLTELFADDSAELMAGRSYVQAALHLVPNLGSRDSSLSQSGYFRTNVWITEQLDPISAAHNIGMGSSGIGEPYANFGYCGVVLIFVLLGYWGTRCELGALRYASSRSYGVLIAMFVPTCWYIRDDVFGTLRSIVWPLVLIACVRAMLHATSSSARSAESTRPI